MCVFIGGKCKLNIIAITFNGLPLGYTVAASANKNILGYFNRLYTGNSANKMYLPI